MKFIHAKSTRDADAVANSLEKRIQTAKNNDKTMPAIIEAVTAVEF